MIPAWQRSRGVSSEASWSPACPLAVVVFGSIGLRAAQVVVGVSTSSFRDLPRVTGRDNVDDVIRALQAAGATHVELAFANVEPAPPSTAPVMGGSAAYPRRIVLSPEEVAATNASARTALRTWRHEAAAGLLRDGAAQVDRRRTDRARLRARLRRLVYR